MRQAQPENYATRADSVEFARRTRKNLAFILEAAREHRGEVHEVTQLVNSLLGLVVFPWERSFAKSAARISVAGLVRRGWPEWKVEVGESPNLWDLIRHLRNGIAHGNVIYSSDDPDHTKVTITIQNWTEYKDDQGKSVWELSWRGEIQADALLEFCYRFIDLVDNRIG